VKFTAQTVPLPNTKRLATGFKICRDKVLLCLTVTIERVVNVHERHPLFEQQSQREFVVRRDRKVEINPAAACRPLSSREHCRTWKHPTEVEPTLKKVTAIQYLTTLLLSSTYMRSSHARWVSVSMNASSTVRNTPLGYICRPHSEC
jgi:hypothetical protein